MLKYFQFIHKKIKLFDKVAHNPFLQKDNVYNPCQNCIAQTYVWIEEDIKKSIFSSNPFRK